MVILKLPEIKIKEYIYSSKTNNMKIILPEKVLKYIHKECISAKGYETGGILIGDYSSDLIEAKIISALGPTEDSKKGLCSFYRGTKDLKKIFNLSWKTKKFYIGEWHYHPNSSSIPSSVDIKQMITISQSKKANCPEPILLVVGGNKKLWNHTILVIKDTQVIYFLDKTK